MNHDYAHCNGNGCSMREKCKRYLLHLDATERKIIHVVYMDTDQKGDECKFYWEDERWS